MQFIKCCGRKYDCKEFIVFNGYDWGEFDRAGWKAYKLPMDEARAFGDDTIYLCPTCITKREARLWLNEFFK